MRLLRYGDVRFGVDHRAYRQTVHLHFEIDAVAFLLVAHCALHSSTVPFSLKVQAHCNHSKKYHSIIIINDIENDSTRPGQDRAQVASFAGKRLPN
jgi:hypothetical protein